ncbi:MAG: hypothetical protein RL387_87 [Bacteroidota bacterium]|jgi:hypothetical protein
MSISRRHHYLPIFYLNNFTDENEQFDVLNVKINYIKPGPHYPAKFFYEIDDNNVKIEGKETDFIEKEFGKIDDKASKVFENIRKNITLNEEEQSTLAYFINSLYWRIKPNQSFVHSLISNAYTLNDFGLKLVHENGEEIPSNLHAEILQKMKNDNDFFKFYRLMQAPLNYIKHLNSSIPYTHIINLDFNLPSIISDNPFIFNANNVTSPATEELIFPISNKKVLIRSSVESLKIIPQLRFMIDMYLVEQASEYIAFTDKLYLGLLQKTFENEYVTLENLKKSIFESIRN